MDYAAIQQAALSLTPDERTDLLRPLMRSLRGLSKEAIKRGVELPPAGLEEARKKAEKIDSTLVQDALSLPVEERDRLAAKLIHSIDAEIRGEGVSLEERERLEDKLMLGLDEGIPGEEVSGEEWEEAWRIEIERRAASGGG